MSAHSLDTHRIVKRLQQAGFSDAQAETVTDVMREARDLDLSNLATKADHATLKSDIAALRTELKSDIAVLDGKVSTLRAEVNLLRDDVSDLQAAVKQLAVGQAAIRSEIAEAKADILKWVIGIVLVQGGVVVTLMRLLPGLGH